MKKIFNSIIALLLVTLFSTSVFAATSVSKGDATMSLVENNVCSITFGEYGEFEKKMINFNKDEKTIDIGLTVKNNKKEEVQKDLEVVLLIDTSNSMSTRRVHFDNSEYTRKQLVVKAASELISKLYSSNNDSKVGIVAFATSTDPEKEGTDDDAKIITDTLTSNPTEVKEALDELLDDTNKDLFGPRTNIEVGLDKANELLKTSTNENASKHIVVLTDAIPNTSRTDRSKYEDGDVIPTICDLYTEATADPTKKKLQELDEAGIDIISMLIDIPTDEIILTGRPEDSKFKTYKDVANYVFGSSVNPTSGSVYYIDDSKIVDTVTNKIYEDLGPTNKYELTNIVIKDYFPQNIIDNFDFAVLETANLGKIDAKVNTADNSITWTISELKPGEVGTYKYRLSLKNTFSSEIVGINLPTNKNVTIDYVENGKDGPQKENPKCPVVIIDVPAPKKIPQTGNNTWFIVGSLVIASIVIATASFINYKKNS